jgi:serine/threonine-protein kinase RsbW
MYRYGKTDHSEGNSVDLGLTEKVQCVRVHAPKEVEAILDQLEGWMRILGYPRKDIFAVRLVVHEAATNAFCHGNRGDLSKYIRVSSLVTPGEVLVGVEDQGQGFDPRLVPNPLHEELLDRPCGRGLFLMRAYATWVTFDPPGNRVTLCRRRSESGAAELPGTSCPVKP